MQARAQAQAQQQQQQQQRQQVVLGADGREVAAPPTPPTQQPPAAAQGGGAPAGELVTSVSDADPAAFNQAVMETSQSVPVIVDFWASWCGPCKQLTPRLEAAIKALGGRVRLVKVNSDDSPQISQAFQIKALPTLVAVLGGKAAGKIEGAVPDDQLEQFLSQVVAAGERLGLSGGAAGGQAPQDPNEQMLTSAAKELDSLAAEAVGTAISDSASAPRLGWLSMVPAPAAQPGAEQRLANAEAACQVVLAQVSAAAAAAEPAAAAQRAQARAVLVLSALARGDAEGAASIAEAGKEDLDADPSAPLVSVALRALEVSAQAADAEAELGPLRAAAEAAAGTEGAAEAQLALARRAAELGQEEAALDIGLSLLRADKENEAARDLLVAVMSALGPKHPATIKGRKKMSAYLFA